MRKTTVFLSALATATACLLIGVGVLSAGVATDTDTVPLTPTNWSDTLDVSQFDPANGALQSVELAFEATVDGTAAYESQDAAPAEIALRLRADIELLRPGTLTSLSLLAPLVDQADSANEFDGVIDFLGPSGGTFPGLTATLSDNPILNSPADLALFTGTGALAFPVSATGTSTGSGAGNLIQSFMTNAAATLTVTYSFAAIDIEKATNGVDADLPTGPVIPEGDPVSWTYVVTNTGNVALANVVVSDDQGVVVSCPLDTLAVGGSMICTAAGTAEAGQYANVSTVVGDALGGPVTDTDPSHYFGMEAEVCVPDEKGKKGKKGKPRPKPWPPGTELVEIDGVAYLVSWKGRKRVVRIGKIDYPVTKEPGKFLVTVDGVDYDIAIVPGQGQFSAGGPTPCPKGDVKDKPKEHGKKRDARPSADETKSKDGRAIVPSDKSCLSSKRYWLRGEGKHDAAWSQIGTNGKKTRFFGNRLAYHKVLRKPSSQPYYKLARGYITAMLNEHSGLSITPEMQRSMTWAERHFSGRAARYTNVKRALKLQQASGSKGHTCGGSRSSAGRCCNMRPRSTTTVACLAAPARPGRYRSGTARRPSDGTARRLARARPAARPPASGISRRRE